MRGVWNGPVNTMWFSLVMSAKAGIESSVIPAKAEIQSFVIPAKAGIQSAQFMTLDPRLRGGDDSVR